MEIENLDLHNNVEYMLDLTTARIVHKIRNKMEQQNVLPEELARQIKKSKRYVVKLLDERVSLSIKNLIKISIALNCELEVDIKRQD